MPSLSRQITSHSGIRSIAALALPMLLAATPVSAQLPPAEVPVLSKPDRSGKAGENSPSPSPESARKAGNETSAQTYWYDGSRKQLLRIDPAEVADFGNRESAGAVPTITAADKLASKSQDAEHVSPLLRDARTGKLAGALPGGVLVRFNRAVNEQQAGAIAAAFGSQIEHPVGAPDAAGHTLWLFSAPAGLASLELANRIHESGQVRSAAPNWWKPRALK